MHGADHREPRQRRTDMIVMYRGGCIQCRGYLFHHLAQQGLGPEDVLAELERRFGTSGIDEKARRVES